MIVRWKNALVCTTEFVASKDEYNLFDADGDYVDTVSRIEFMSNPYLRRLPNGRHRRTFASYYGGALNPAGNAGGGNALAPGGITFTPAKPGRTVRTRLPPVNWQTIHYISWGEPEPKPPLRRDGIVAGEIVGFRCWIVQDMLLRSVYQTDIWLPGETLVGRELEDWGHRGIHAWKSPASKQYHEYIRGYLNTSERNIQVCLMIYGTAKAQPARPAMVTGSVYLWGDVVEHERGYRAEFARVRSIDWLYPDESMMGREAEALHYLRRKYNV